MSDLNELFQLTSSSVEGQQQTPQMSAEELYLSKGAPHVVDTSSGSSFEVGHQENESLMGHAVLAAAAISPTVAKVMVSNPFDRALLSDTAVAALQEVVDNEEMADMDASSYGERYELLRQKKTQKMEEFYGNVLPSEGYRTLGNMARAVQDPSTLLPAGQTFKAGAAIGGGLAGTDTALNQYLNTGEVDLKSTLIATAGGAVIGGAVAKAGSVFSNWLDARVDQGMPVQEEEVTLLLEHIKQNKGGTYDKEVISSIDTKSLTDEINSKFKLSESQALKDAISASNKLFKGEETNKSTEELLEVLSRNKSMDNVTESETYKTLNFIESLELETPEKISIRERKVLGKKPGKSLVTSKGSEWVADEELSIALNSARKASDVLEELEKTLPTGPNGELSEGFREALGSTPEKPITSKADAVNAITTGDIPVGSPAGQKLYNPVGKMIKDINAKLTPEDIERIAASHAEDNITIRPTTFLGSLGKGGKALAGIYRRAQEELHLAKGDALRTADVAFSKAKQATGMSKEMVKTETANAMRSVKYFKQSSKEIQEAARAVRKEMNKAVRFYRDNGFISDSDAARFIANQEYFPRVYDKARLATEKGKQEFIEALSNHRWTEAQLDRVVKNILGNPKVRPAGITKMPDGTYKLSKSVSQMIYRQRSVSASKKTSNHMEKDRTLDIPDEVISDFLINDAHMVLESYLEDTMKRGIYAKYLGKEGEVVHEYARKLDSAIGRESLGKKVRETYWHMIGSAEAPGVKKAMEFTSRPSKVKTSLAAVNSIETAKLLLAPIVNSTQATVAGSVLLARQTGSFTKTASIFAKGVKKTFGDYKNSIDAAERSGAAIEQTVMQAHAELGEVYQKWSTGFLQGTGFVYVERLQRTLAYNMGKAHVEDLLAQKNDLLSKIARQGNGKQFTKALDRVNNILEEMGIDSQAATKDIPVAEMERAAQRFSNTVNFVRDADQLPHWAQSPYASLVTKFKTFAYWWSGFIWDNAGKQAAEFIRTGGKEGTVKPLMTFLGVGLPAGYAAASAKDNLKEFIFDHLGIDKRKQEDTSWLKEGLDAISVVGGFGLFYDTVRTGVEYGPGFAFGAILGPGISDSLKLGTEVVKGAGDILTEGDFESAGKKVVKGAAAFSPPIFSDIMKDSVKDVKTFNRRSRSRDFNRR